MKAAAPGTRVYVAQLANAQPRPAFGMAKDAIYFGEKGKLWRIDAATGKRDEVKFSAEITFEFYPGSPIPVYSEKRAASPTSILTPRLTPDGESVIFTAAGYLWRQPVSPEARPSDCSTPVALSGARRRSPPTARGSRIKSVKGKRSSLESRTWRPAKAPP